MATVKAKGIAAAVIAFAALGGAVYVAKKIITTDDITGKTISVASSSTTGPAPTIDANWKSRFDSVYSLAPGQVLKHISPPYIRERADYFNAVERPVYGGRYSSRIWFAFSWDGSLHREFWSDGAGTAGTALTEGLGLRPYQVEGVDLWKIPFPDDLICRKSASPDERMNAFASVLSVVLGRTIRFEKSRAVRNAIVLRGTYVPPKRPDGKDAIIQIRPLNLTTRPSPMISGTNIDSYCDSLEVQTRMQVVNQIATHYRGLVLYSIDQTPPDISHHPDQLQSLLSNLASQTGLQYTLEPREIELWTWVEG